MREIVKRHDPPIERLRRFALSLPEAWEDFPWGESVGKVGKKVFVFLGHAAKDGPPAIGLSVKLRESHDEALAQPYSSPTGYGLGKAGWVSISMVGAAEVKRAPVELFEDWIEESYRLVAPKKLVAALDVRAPS